VFHAGGFLLENLRHSGEGALEFPERGAKGGHLGVGGGDLATGELDDASRGGDVGFQGGGHSRELLQDGRGQAEPLIPDEGIPQRRCMFGEVGGGLPGGRGIGATGGVEREEHVAAKGVVHHVRLLVVLQPLQNFHDGVVSFAHSRELVPDGEGEGDQQGSGGESEDPDLLVDVEIHRV